MMFTFLTGEYRGKIIGEYRKTLCIFSLALIILICLVLAGLALPAYISLRTERQGLLLEKEVYSQRLVESGQAEIETQVKDIKEMVATVKDDSTNGALVTVIENILLGKNASVSLSAVSLERKKDAWAVTVGGIADNRESLVDFREKLELVPAFSAVDLPVSSLAKNKNIPFSLSLKSKL